VPATLCCAAGGGDCFSSFPLLENYTAGDPMQEQVRWTNLTYQEIIDHMSAEGITISKPVVKQLLKKHGYVKRKAQKRLSTGEHRDRNAQFEHIAGLKTEYEGSGNPIISVDTKKKEPIGHLYREGELYTREEIAVFDKETIRIIFDDFLPSWNYRAVPSNI
jgi:hypothetical protein